MYKAINASLGAASFLYQTCRYMRITIAGEIMLLVFLLCLVPRAVAVQFESINGQVLYEGQPLCALVLANGQSMFSCKKNLGTFDLNVPLDSNGMVTLMVFASEYMPFRQKMTPAESRNIIVNMVPAYLDSEQLKVDASVSPNGEKRAIISGTIANKEKPSCALVLANGQSMFSCNQSLGTFNLDVPLDANGEITLMGFASDTQPFRTTINCTEIGDPCEFHSFIDSDYDGIDSSVDNCPNIFNPIQEDIDEDNRGDRCDPWVPILYPFNIPNGIFFDSRIVIAEYDNGLIIYENTVIDNAVVVKDMREDYPIFDHDGPGIGNNRECSVDHIDCTPTRDCTYDHIDCSATRDCSNLHHSHDTRNCRKCVPFLGCFNDPFCEAAKAAQNVIYDADYARRVLECETKKAAEKLVCEIDKSAQKVNCETIKAGEKIACEVDKSAQKADCERLKLMQSAAGEIWEAAIQESRKQAHFENPRPIPAFIRTALEPYFDAELLDSIVWTDDHGNVFSVASKLATELGRRKAITLGDIIVFKSNSVAMFDIGIWAHELEHIKQYKLLGIAHFAEYYADYWLAAPDADMKGFPTIPDPTPEEIKEFVGRQWNKLEALATVQSQHVCRAIDRGKSWSIHWPDKLVNEQVIDKAIIGTCRPNSR